MKKKRALAIGICLMLTFSGANVYAADTAQEDTVTRDKTVNREEDDSRQIAAEMAQDSVLDRYLNRDVLPHK